MEFEEEVCERSVRTVEEGAYTEEEEDQEEEPALRAACDIS
jgi:hypothetical protein